MFAQYPLAACLSSDEGRITLEAPQTKSQIVVEFLV
jgi:hypothetical protein